MKEEVKDWVREQVRPRLGAFWRAAKPRVLWCLIGLVTGGLAGSYNTLRLFNEHGGELGAYLMYQGARLAGYSDLQGFSWQIFNGGDAVIEDPQARYLLAEGAPRPDKFTEPPPEKPPLRAASARESKPNKGKKGT